MWPRSIFNPNALPELLKNVGPLPGPVTPSSIEVVFPADYKVQDGRYANNAWLQELPDPITKLTWDNAVLLSKSTARALQVDDGDMVEISVRRSKIAGARDDGAGTRRLFAQSFTRVRAMGGWPGRTGNRVQRLRVANHQRSLLCH